MQVRFFQLSTRHPLSSHVACVDKIIPHFEKYGLALWARIALLLHFFSFLFWMKPPSSFFPLYRNTSGR